MNKCEMCKQLKSALDSRDDTIADLRHELSEEKAAHKYRIARCNEARDALRKAKSQRDEAEKAAKYFMARLDEKENGVR